MHTTIFAGLTELDPDESISADGAAIQARNPSLTDYFLRIGAVTHRHDAHPAMPDPTVAPSALAVPSGGMIPADLDLEVGYTLVDPQGGETLLSPTVVVSTQAGLEPPDNQPTVEMDYTAGTLRIDTYFYGISYLDESGGETSLGPMIQISRDPGFASAQVLLSDLAVGMEDVGAAAWKLYRARGGTDFAYIASGTEDTFTDTGDICADCNTAPPTQGNNTTGSTTLLRVTLPADEPELAAAEWIKLYVSVDGSFGIPSLLDSYPVASGGATIDFPTLDLLDDRPPAVATTVQGANRIDPDTELIDWHWKRPVADSAALPSGAEEGDVRIVLDPGIPYAFIDGSWAPWDTSGTALTASAVNASAALLDQIDFRASGAAEVTLEELAPGHALVTVYAPSGGGGGASLTNPLGTEIVWTDVHGSAAVRLVGRERRDDTNYLVASDWASEPDDTVLGNYEFQGGELVGSDTSNTIDSYQNLSGLNTVQYGRAERTVRIGDPSTVPWWRIGVGLGAGGKMLAAWITDEDPAPNRLVLGYRVDTSGAGANDDAGWVEIADADFPAALVADDVVNFEVKLLPENRISAAAFISKALVAEVVEMDMPIGAVADLGEGGTVPNKSLFTADRWGAQPPPAFYTTWAALHRYDYHRELRVYARDRSGATVERELLDDLGRDEVALDTMANYSAGWTDGANPPSLYRDMEGVWRLAGKVTKTSGSAPVADEVIATITTVFPMGQTDVAAMTGDSDGNELGMVRINSSGEIIWLAGRSTTPATKSPFVSLDGLFFRT